MESLAFNIVEQILTGFFDRAIITCPICKSIIDCTGQDAETISNFYYCKKCGFIVSRKNIDRNTLNFCDCE